MTTFLADFVKHPVTSLLFAGKYVKQFIVWLGGLLKVDLSAIGNVFYIITEILIIGLIIKLFCFIVRRIKDVKRTIKND